MSRRVVTSQDMQGKTLSLKNWTGRNNDSDLRLLTT